MFTGALNTFKKILDLHLSRRLLAFSGLFGLWSSLRLRRQELLPFHQWLNQVVKPHHYVVEIIHQGLDVTISLARKLARNSC